MLYDIEFVALDDETKIASRLAGFFNKKLILPKIKTFKDGESLVSLPDNPVDFKNKKVFVIDSLHKPVHFKLLNFLHLIYELRKNGAKDICAVFPYLCYMRQDESDGLGFVASLIESSGVSGVVVVQAHSDKIFKSFSVPVHHVCLSNTIAQSIKDAIGDTKNCVVVAPDKGSTRQAKKVARLINCDLVTIEKERSKSGELNVKNISGDCKNKDIIIVDDMIDSGATAIRVGKTLEEMGAKKLYSYFVHPVFSGDGFENVESCCHFEKIFVSNTIPMKRPMNNKLEIFDCVDSIIEIIKKLV